MIILPDRNIPRAKFLMPVADTQWTAPSQAQQKDQFGNENQTRFRLRARLNDGYTVWTGWFDDRHDLDAFLWAIANNTLRYERKLWDLPTPAWSPYLGEHLDFEFATVSFLTSTSAANQTFSVPIDWLNTSNKVEVIAGGGSGGRGYYGRAVTGGGGGAYSAQTNITLTQGGTATFFLNAAAAAIVFVGSGTTSSGAVGNLGADAWFNGTTLALSSVGAKGGNPGQQAASGTTAASAAGGAAASGTGATKNSGGASGTAIFTTTTSASGGGGAAGPNGAGGASPNQSNTTGIGGTADNGTVAGGAINGGAGNSGTEFDATHGCGSGSGGTYTSPNATAGVGGAYGGGGAGAAADSGTVTTGAGGQGLIVVTYTPSFVYSWNMPMLGM